MCVRVCLLWETSSHISKHNHDYNNNLTCCDGSGGLEKAKLSLVASWDTAFTAWSEGKGESYIPFEVVIKFHGNLLCVLGMEQ